MLLLVRKMNTLNTVDEKTPSEVLRTLCCDPRNESCLEQCITCKSKLIQIKDDPVDSPVFFQRWTAKQVPVQFKDKIKFMSNHQCEEISQLKKNILQNEVLVHVDFSENYTCKYSKEIQSAHFGGSKPQVTIHTCVLYCHTDVAKTPILYGTVSS
ncbi:hypothetical protein PR048_023375, partial [Dryococelus australis]